MRRLLLFIMVLSVVAPVTTHAQRNKNRRGKTAHPAAVAEETPAQKLYNSMLPATAKVFFFDSVVVDKADFLKQIPLPEDMGSIVCKDGTTTYENGFRDLVYVAQGDSTTRRLYTANRLGETWSQSSPVAGIGSDLAEPDFPFLASDGTILYFAAKGDKSLGGYDIFVTTLNADTRQFYEPENMGLPYNSSANEYLLAVDDLDSIGWLVSDRHQPEGKVCVYLFVPTAQRESYESQNLDEHTLKRYADITTIKDTWSYGKREKAMARLRSLLAQARKNASSTADDINFVISDDVVYHQLSDFKSTTSRQSYAQVVKLRQQLEQTNGRLDTLRQEYHGMGKSSRRTLQQQILRQERDAEDLQEQIVTLEKKIRNAEIESTQ